MFIKFICPADSKCQRKIRQIFTILNYNKTAMYYPKKGGEDRVLYVYCLKAEEEEENEDCFASEREADDLKDEIMITTMIINK